MNIENLLSTYENKIIAIEAKIQTSINKGNIELLSVFNNELIETKVALGILKRGLGDSVKDTGDVKAKVDLVLNEFRNYIDKEINKIQNELNNTTGVILDTFNEIKIQFKLDMEKEISICDKNMKEGLMALYSNYKKEFDKLNTVMEMYNKGNRFVRMYKILIGKL